MQMFGVGRPAVREALFAMQRMGLVAINSGERARVTRPTPQVMFESLAGPVRHLLSAPEGVHHFQEARTFFEVGLARHAAEHATKDEVDQLQQALAANQAAIDNVAAFERTDVAFHYVLAVIPRNPIYTAIHQAIAAWLTEQRHVTLQRAGQNQIAYRGASCGIRRHCRARSGPRGKGHARPYGTGHKDLLGNKREERWGDTWCWSNSS